MTEEGPRAIFYEAFRAGSGLISLLDLVNEHGDEPLKALCLDSVSRALGEVASIDNKVRKLFPELHAEVEEDVRLNGLPK